MNTQPVVEIARHRDVLVTARGIPSDVRVACS